MDLVTALFLSRCRVRRRWIKLVVLKALSASSGSSFAQLASRTETGAEPAASRSPWTSVFSRPVPSRKSAPESRKMRSDMRQSFSMSSEGWALRDGIDPIYQLRRTTSTWMGSSPDLIRLASRSARLTGESRKPKRTVKRQARKARRPTREHSSFRHAACTHTSY